MLRVARYQTWQELQELRSRWNSLLSHSSSDTVFLTWQWCEAWWKNYGGGREIFVLAAWDKAELVGVAPLCSRSGSPLWVQTWRRLRFMGRWFWTMLDYLDCFVQHGREAETMAAFADYLGDEHKSWDWMELDGPGKRRAALQLWSDVPAKGTGALKVESIPGATLMLPGSWEEYLRMLELAVQNEGAVFARAV